MFYNVYFFINKCKVYSSGRQMSEGWLGGQAFIFYISVKQKLPIVCGIIWKKLNEE